MSSTEIQAPVPLLLCPDLTPSAKIIWLAARLQAEPKKLNVSTLARSTGLARLTVRKAISQLKAAGWSPLPAEGHGKTVPIPTRLLTDGRIGAQARLLVALLQLLPGYCHPGGKLAYQELANLSGLSRNTAAKALDELAGSKWVVLQRANRLAPVHFELSSPAQESIKESRSRLANVEHYGEVLMREFLSLLVDSDRFKDNVFPTFLVNPRTEEAMQLDRFYPPGVAFEFNGPQHYRSTHRFTSDEVARQRSRDLMKLGICVTHAITMIVIQPEDLSVDTLRQKIGTLLPLRDLTGLEPVADFLESESREYQSWMARL